MQWMKTNAVAIWIEDGIGEYVVDVNEHCRHHYQIGFLPVFTKESYRNTRRYSKMKY